MQCVPSINNSFTYFSVRRHRMWSRTHTHTRHRTPLFTSPFSISIQNANDASQLSGVTTRIAAANTLECQISVYLQRNQQWCSRLFKCSKPRNINFCLKRKRQAINKVDFSILLRRLVLFAFCFFCGTHWLFICAQRGRSAERHTTVVQ